jgi:acid phosphatase
VDLVTTGQWVADWAERHDSVLVLTWDEDDSSQANHITTIFAGRGCGPAARPSRSPTHRLATIEAAYTLPRDERASTVVRITNIWLA